MIGGGKGKVEDVDKSLLEHIEELRSVLIRCFVAILVVLPFALMAAPSVLDWFVERILAGVKVELNYFSPVEVFVVQLKTAFVFTVALCSPYIANKIWDFVLPALYDREARMGLRLGLASGFLFILGASFCIFLVLPLIVRFGISFSTPNIRPVLGISEVVNLGFWLTFSFGVMFQVPLVAFSLVRTGILPRTSVGAMRPYVIVGLLVVAAIVTPPDIISQLMVFVPSYLLFEIGLFLAGKGAEKGGD